MKKSISFLTAFIALCSAVSCSSDGKKEPSPPMNEAVYNEEGKPVITVGTFGYSEPLFNDHLNKPKDMEIKVVNYAAGIEADYSTKESQNAYYAAINNQLNTALISGEAPDIICTNVADMQNLGNKGVLTDLYPLMDKNDELKRADFLPCVLEGLEIEGKLPAIMESYYIYTAIAKTKFIPKEYENWTSDEAISFYEKYKGQMDFYERTSETDLADYMLKVMGLGSVDKRNNTCDFNETFSNTLQFCIDNPVDVIPPPDFEHMNDTAINDYHNDQQTRGLNDTQLVFPLSINGFDSALGQHTYGFFNKEDITFVGYPSENGVGAYVQSANPLYAITEHSSNKDAAWKLLSAIIKHQKKLETYMSDGTRGVPVLWEQLQRDYDRSDDYNNSINNGFMWNWNNYGEEEFITQEYKDMLYDYILSVPANPYFYNWDLQNIIDEEVECALNGDRSAEEAAKVLNSRIGTYLSEKS